jgi:hypothetical protein
MNHRAFVSRRVVKRGGLSPAVTNVWYFQCSGANRYSLGGT